MKSDFVSFATHQLRTPLAGIKWLLELAREELGLSEDLLSYIQDARESADRLIKLVNDLLDISRLERGKLGRCGTLSPRLHARLVIAQRLVRRICASCRESVVPDASVLKALRVRPDFDRAIQLLQDQGVLGKGEEPLASIRLFRGKGCAQCHGSGFRDHLGVFELFELDDHIRRMIMERQDTSAIRAEAIARGMKAMFQDGLAKVFFGETTLEEVFRVAP